MNFELTQEEIQSLTNLRMDRRNTFTEEGEAISKICMAMDNLAPLSRLAVFHAVYSQCQQSFHIEAREMRLIAEILNRIAEQLAQKP